MARKSFFLLFSLGFFMTLAAQDSLQIATLQAEIDAQIWKPFAESYQELDADKFNALHTDDVLRGGPWGLRIGAEYKESIQKNYANDRKRGAKQRIQFRFEHRVTRPEVSYEVGYYKVEVERDGKQSQFYGQFHVVIRKIDGKWKIVQDWDADKINGEEVSEKHFLGQ